LAPQAAPAASLSQYTAKAKEAYSKIELNKYDVEAWKALITEVQTGPMKHLGALLYWYKSTCLTGAKAQILTPHGA
jgi:hypothetical protein